MCSDMLPHFQYGDGLCVYDWLYCPFLRNTFSASTVIIPERESTLEKEE